MKPAPVLLSVLLALVVTGPGRAVAADATLTNGAADIGQNRKALAEARAAADDARRRGEKLEADAAAATAAATRTAADAAAVAARIQQAQAQIMADEATIRIITRQQAELRDNLAAREWPLLRLTAALQRLSRRPLALAVLQPGSVSDAAHLRAVLASTMPEVRRHTAALRGQLAAMRGLRQQAVRAQGALAAQKATLGARQNQLVVLEARQRLAASASAGGADRETERADTLAEQARDLCDLVGRLEQAAVLGARLELLPGPLIRPPRPGQSEVVSLPAPAPAPSAPSGYVLPVAGRLVTGFGDVVNGGGMNGAEPSRGLTIAVEPGAQVVAPAAGRVVFAAAYHGFGDIIILDHSGGWTSLVTGLGRLDVRVGDMLVGGAPLGIAAPGMAGGVTLELRHDGQPVNPLEQMRLP